jgi:hypothetical protein
MEGDEAFLFTLRTFYPWAGCSYSFLLLSFLSLRSALDDDDDDDPICTIRIPLCQNHTRAFTRNFFPHVASGSLRSFCFGSCFPLDGGM